MFLNLYVRSHESLVGAFAFYYFQQNDISHLVHCKATMVDPWQFSYSYTHNKIEEPTGKLFELCYIRIIYSQLARPSWKTVVFQDFERQTNANFLNKLCFLCLFICDIETCIAFYRLNYDFVLNANQFI